MRTVRAKYEVRYSSDNEDDEEGYQSERYVAFSAARARREKLIELGTHPDSISIDDIEEDEEQECFGG